MKVFILILALVGFALSGVAQTPVTIFLAGDSTMAPKLAEKRPETGWGEKLEAHFKPGRIIVDNRALNGRSTKTFITEGKWIALMADVKKGDFVFIQFGHNDQAKTKAERYTPPDDFKSNLVKFVEEVRAKGANPVLMTPVMRRRFDSNGKFYDTHGDYPGYTRAVSAEYKVPLIDMQQKSEAVIIKYGVDQSKKLFLQLKPGENLNYPNGIEDNTHFSPHGSEKMAKLAAEGIKETKIGLVKYLKK